MTEWERFAENLAALLGGNPVGTEAMLAEHGWTQRDEEGLGLVWEFQVPHRQPRYFFSYQEFAAQIVIGLRASKVATPQELTVQGWNNCLEEADPDLSVLGI